MKTIKIWVNDIAFKEKINAMIKENEDMGFNKNTIPKIKEKCWLADFFFDENMFSGYWIDNEIDETTGTIDIIFYVGPTSFKTPSSGINKIFFNQILIDRQK